MPKKTEREDPLGFCNMHSVAKCQKMKKGGHFGGKKNKNKSHSADKSKGEILWSRPVLYVMRETFWLSSMGQVVQFGVFSKVYRTFGRNILVTSGGL